MLSNPQQVHQCEMWNSFECSSDGRHVLGNNSSIAFDITCHRVCRKECHTGSSQPNPHVHSIDSCHQQEHVLGSSRRFQTIQFSLHGSTVAQSGCSSFASAREGPCSNLISQNCSSSSRMPRFLHQKGKSFNVATSQVAHAICSSFSQVRKVLTAYVVKDPVIHKYLWFLSSNTTKLYRCFFQVA